MSLGDTVKEGQVLCIIEAMKLMNEIEADASGEIVKRFVSNGSPVEYGMPLFGIRKTLAACSARSRLRHRRHAAVQH